MSKQNYRKTYNKRRRKRIKPEALFILGLIFVVLILFILIISTRSKKIYHNYDYNEVQTVNYPTHNYKIPNFYFENGVLAYNDEIYTSMTGIDVSNHQGKIDFNKVKEDGIEFVYIRLGYRGYQSGQLNLDDMFETYYEQAKNAGLQVGVYYFSSAINIQEAMDEAYFVLDHIKDKQLDLPIAYDYEDIDYDTSRIESVSNKTRTDNALAFCQIIQEGNYTPIIYASSYWLNDIYDLSKIYNYDVWLAQYNDTLNYPYEFKIWQYTQNGTVDGIEKPVDINIMMINKK